MTRLGLAASFFHTFGPADYVALAREAEQRGYDTLWTGEVAGPDAFTILTLVAAHTTRLRLATGVIPFQTRTPTVLGQTAATLNHIAAGRFALGLVFANREFGRHDLCHGPPFPDAVTDVRL